MDSITRTKKSQKVTIVGAIVDFLLSIFKVTIGVIGNSGALVADGVHSFSDLLSDWAVSYTHLRAHET